MTPDGPDYNEAFDFVTQHRCVSIMPGHWNATIYDLAKLLARVRREGAKLAQAPRKDSE